MKTCFIGSGSIGKRHIINFVETSKALGFKIDVDLLRGTENPLPDSIEALIQNQYQSMKDLPDDYDIAFVTNPTYLHYDTIMQVIEKTKHMFIEKPLFHTIDLEFPESLFKKGNIYYVAAPLRFSPIIEFLKSEIDPSTIYSARAVSSSYLPDWRRGADYRSSYSAQAWKGGGVILDLIHEWDYMRYLFGDPMKILKLSGKYSKLEIDCDDLALYLAQYHNKMIEIHLDYFGRKSMRQLTLYTEDDTIAADFIENSIEYRVTGQKINLPAEDMYKKEIRYFINLITGSGSNLNPPKYAFETMKFAFGEGMI